MQLKLLLYFLKSSKARGPPMGGQAIDKTALKCQFSSMSQRWENLS